MLKFARLREAGGASLKPRNDGPLIAGELFVLRDSSGAGGRGALAVAGEDACGAADALRVAAGTGESSVPPHMPQNRIPSEFSFPHRGQRTGFSFLLAYDILRVHCRKEMCRGRLVRATQVYLLLVMPQNNLSQETLDAVVQGHHLEVLRIVSPAKTTELVFLHEGLGSISHWRNFPARVAQAAGCAVTVYSRYGNGNSDVLAASRSVRYMHDEALHALPELLSQLRIENPVLVGHSDGASIAIIYAGAHDRVRGLILVAPHVFVEDLSVQSIAQAKTTFQTTDLPQKLARHHRDAVRTFWGWNDIWLHPHFRNWNIEEYLPKITCPVLVIQGEEDQYGSWAQVEAIQRQTAGAVEVLALPNCKHSPQRDQPEATMRAMKRFLESLPR